MPERISRDGFVAFARTLAGRELVTLTRHQPFAVSLTAKGIAFVPDSTGKPRPPSVPEIDRVLEEFAARGSLRPIDYRRISGTASYLLTLIAMYRERD